MSGVTRGVILLDPKPTGASLLFDQKIAGLPVFHRLVLALHRAGIKRLLVLSRNLDEKERTRWEEILNADLRLRGRVLWIDPEQFLRGEANEWVEAAKDSSGVLVAGANVVATPQLIQTFLRDALNTWSLGHHGVASLGPSGNDRGGIHLVASDKLDIVRAFAENRVIREPVEVISPSGSFRYWTALADPGELPQSEQNLIDEHRQHYTQLMDVHCNSLLSLKISRYLVRLPFSPNHLTLFGLLIGLASGYFFALGNYWSGVVGALLAAFTAVWDCCDGDVARLRFEESDFGEALDTTCDNIINIFVFGGIALGVGRQQGWEQALLPFLLLALGGGLIFGLIYFPRGQGKGGFFKGTKLHDVIELLASRNFIYVIALFGIVGKLDWFLWLAGYGSLVFALVIYLTKRQMRKRH